MLRSAGANANVTGLTSEVAVHCAVCTLETICYEMQHDINYQFDINWCWWGPYFFLCDALAGSSSWPAACYDM